MVVQHNLQAMNASRMLGVTTSSQSKATEKLSSGYRINRAADDAAGLTISEKMRKQMRGLDRASTNAQDGISAVQTAEGALTEVHSMLQRMNELAVQASNGTNSEDDRQAIQDEIDQLITEIDRVSETTKFNEIYLLKGDPATAKEETTTTYTFELTDVAKAAEKGTISISATAPGALYGAGETDAVKADVAAAGASMKVDQTELDKIAAGTNLYADDGKGGGYTRVTDANAKDYFDVADNGTVSVKAGVTYRSATSDADATGNTGSAGNVTAANAVTYIKGTAAAAGASGNLDKYVELDKDNKLKYKDGQMLYTAAADATGEYGEQKEATAIAEANLGTYFEVNANPLTKSDGTTKIEAADLKDYFENGAYKGGIFRKDKDGNSKEIGAEQISTYIKSDSKTVTNKTADPLKFNLHVGSESASDNKIGVEIKSMSASGIGVNKLAKDGLMTENAATEAIKTIGEAIKLVSSQRSALGAIQNRLEHTIANLDNVVENTTAAESRIRDTDMADMMVEYSKNNILAQAGQSMLAQANQSTQGVLSLLQ